jgi:hypothetical protein
MPAEDAEELARELSEFSHRETDDPGRDGPAIARSRAGRSPRGAPPRGPAILHSIELK